MSLGKLHFFDGATLIGSMISGSSNETEKNFPANTVVR